MKQLSQKRQVCELFWRTNALRKVKNIHGDKEDVESINQTSSNVGNLEVGPGNYVHASPNISLDFPLCLSVPMSWQNHYSLGGGEGFSGMGSPSLHVLDDGKDRECVTD